MPSSTYRRRQEADEPERRSRRRPAKSGPPLVPIFALLVLIAGSIVLARFVAQNKEPEPPPKEKIDASEIFGDLPEEEPPPPRVHGAGREPITNRAPAGLMDDRTWLEALKIAEQAAVTLAEATRAKANGDHSAWNEKGNAAKELYDKAIEMTALWEDEIREKYGDTDRQVREIMSLRSKWIDKLRILHKTTGRG